MNFSGKIIWITGASSGIGEALAIAFAKEGASLVLSARRKEELERVQKNCGLGNDRALILPFDLGHLENPDELTHTVLTKFGRIDVLVNNGGVSQRSLAKDTPLAIDRQIMEVNFFGQVILTKSVLPVMLKQKSGHIVVVSSVSGKFGYWFRSTYSASKHALQGFFDSLRMETEGEGIKTLIVVPGRILTNISINAMKGDGSKHNIMDKSQAEGMPADKCAALILDAIRSGKEELLVGGKEIKAVWIKRFFPKLFGRLIRKQEKE